MVPTLALVVSAGHADISAPTSNMVVQPLERPRPILHSSSWSPSVHMTENHSPGPNLGMAEPPRPKPCSLRRQV